MSSDKPSAATVDGSTAIKHHLTEEVFDLYVNRRIAARVVAVLLPTPVTANHLTVVAAILGAFAGLLIAQNTTAACGWAAVCLMGSMVLDCADGQLARARGGGSRFGRLLDGASDYTTATALHLGMWAYLASEGVLFRNHLVDGWGLFAWVGLAGLSMALHCSLFDLRKQWFLAHLRPEVAESDDVDDLLEELAELENIFVKGLLGFYILYTRVQQHLRRGLHDQGIAEIQGAAEREAFQSRCTPFLRTAGLIGPTIHLLLIVLAMVAAPFFPQAFWWYVLTVSVPMNLVFIGLVFWGGRLDAQFDAQP